MCLFDDSVYLALDSGSRIFVPLGKLYVYTGDRFLAVKCRDSVTCDLFIVLRSGYDSLASIGSDILKLFLINIREILVDLLCSYRLVSVKHRIRKSCSVHDIFGILNKRADILISEIVYLILELVGVSVSELAVTEYAVYLLICDLAVKLGELLSGENDIGISLCLIIERIEGVYGVLYRLLISNSDLCGSLAEDVGVDSLELLYLKLCHRFLKASVKSFGSCFFNKIVALIMKQVYVADVRSLALLCLNSGNGINVLLVKVGAALCLVDLVINVVESGSVYVTLRAVVLLLKISEPFVVLTVLGVYVVKYLVLCLCAIKLVGVVFKQLVNIGDLGACRRLYRALCLYFKLLVVFLAVLAVICGKRVRARTECVEKCLVHIGYFSCGISVYLCGGVRIELIVGIAVNTVEDIKYTLELAESLVLISLYSDSLSRSRKYLLVFGSGERIVSAALDLGLGSVNECLYRI